MSRASFLILGLTVFACTSYAETCTSFRPDPTSYPITGVATGTLSSQVYLATGEVLYFNSPDQVNIGFESPEIDAEFVFGADFKSYFERCDGVFPSASSTRDLVFSEGVYHYTVSFQGGTVLIVIEGTESVPIPNCGVGCTNIEYKNSRSFLYNIATGAYTYTLSIDAEWTFFTPESVQNNQDVLSASGSGVAKVISSCSLPELDEITDAVALQFENAIPPGTPPLSSLFANQVDPSLDFKIGQLQTYGFNIGVNIKRLSGYRPLPYQRHLYQLKTRLSEYDNLSDEDAANCQELKNKLDAEMAHHDLQPSPETGLLPVSDPEHSAHILTPAEAVDLGGINGLDASTKAKINKAASILGLVRPCSPKTDPAYHVMLAGGQCAVSILWEVLSPVALLVTGPDGKRIGFDPSAGHVVNEIGQGSYYSGPKSEPQWIEIGAAAVGTYTLSGYGTGSGPFTLRIFKNGEDGEILESTEIKGNIGKAQTISLSTTQPLHVQIDVKPGDSNNTLNPNSNGVIPVALLSSGTFVAPRDVNVSSLRFGASGTESSLAFCTSVDVNGDGILDLLCHFKTQASAFTTTSQHAILTGTLFDGTTIEGTDWLIVAH